MNKILSASETHSEIKLRRTKHYHLSLSFDLTKNRLLVVLAENDHVL